MNALRKASLPDLEQAAETMLRDCMPAGWDWMTSVEHVTQRTFQASGTTTFRDAKRIFKWAVLNVCGVLDAFKSSGIRGARYAGVTKAVAIMGVARQSVENIYQRANGVGADPRISDDAKRSAMQFATHLLLTEKRSYRDAMAEFERKLCFSAIRAAGGYQHKAAYGLGIHRNTIVQVLNREPRLKAVEPTR
jgi:DNA-binding protein Fis